MRRAWLLFVLSGCELIVGSNDAKPLVLDRLTITPGKIDQVIDADTIHYTATVPPTETVKVAAHSSDPDVVIEFSGEPPMPSLANGASSAPIPVQGGSNTIAFKVRAMQANVEASFTIGVNVGGAQLAAPVSHPLNAGGAAPISVDAADFNGDGTLDVVVGFDGVGFRIYNGKTFAPIGPLVSLPGFRSLAIGDLDSKQGPDIVAVSNGTKAAVYLNPGTGLFGAPTLFGAGTHFISVAIGRIDNDTKLDLMLGDDDAGTMTSGSQQWMLGDGLGGFGSPFPIKQIGAHPVGMVIGELDESPDPDVMMLAGKGHAMAIMQGDGTGNLTLAGATSTTDTANENANDPRSLVLAALDDNPLPDYALVHADLGELRVIRNFTGNNQQAAVVATSYPTDMRPNWVIPADLDGDGNQDLIVACPDASKVQMFYGDGKGGLASSAVSTTPGIAPSAVAAADFNRDGLLDLVTVNAATNDLTVLLQETP